MASKVKTPRATKASGGAALEAGSLSNFSGGPNFRDSPSELGPTENYGSWNCTYDERGGVASRLGYVRRQSTPLGTSLVVNEFYSEILQAFITQAGTGLYTADNTTVRHTFSTNDCCTFAEIENYIIVGHPKDGLWYSSDGVTWTQITAANAPTTALCLCTWEAKLFVGMADGTVHWSNAANPLVWTSTDFNSIWTKDQEPIVAMIAGSGQDIQGRPGLIVFKQESVYRINDSGTGAYTVLDTTYGAAGPKAVVGVGARVCYIGKGGIFWWREDQAAPVAAADLLRPLWSSDQLSFQYQNNWCAGRRLNRALFSCSTVNSSINDLAFEFHPDEGWVAPRSDGVVCYSLSSIDGYTYGGSTTVAGQCYQMDTGGTDDGNSISGYFQTRWVVPNGGFQASLWQVRIHGRGSGTMTVRENFENGGGTLYSFTLSAPGLYYDSGVLYDNPANTYAVVTLQETQPFYDLGTCRQFSLLFSFTVNSTSVGRQLFGNAPAPTVGAFGIYGLEYLYVPLGLS